ncbi:LOW QUALITY PROTEIN: syntaxin-8 [Amblyraja radiata]|uniref:LOW QUALITY PROTEIN: syntaxin-8 n=1 Tax=Amblyraja radiata TaxID=386614 RepID=UPI001402A4BD|nr:LOW QUALITY PROTEIN: syntaxin-8 [Amblyraja radiata]
MAGDPWLAKYDSTWRLAQDIAENVHDRNRQQRTGGNPSKFNVMIRSSLQRLQEQINQLKDSLLRNLSTRQITQLEADRHQNMLDDLLTRERQLQTSFKKDGTEPEVMRTSLISTDPKTDLTNPWLMEEPEETRGLGFSEIKHQQHMIIQEQDAGLDALVTVIARQKQMGRDIGNELDEQNEIIDDLTHLVDKTDSRIQNETRRVKLVDRKSTSWGMLVVIVLLLVAIVVVAVWPKG